MPRDYDKLRDQRDLNFIVRGNTFKIKLLPLKMIGVWSEREDKVKVEDQEAFHQMMIDRVADAVADGNGSEKRWRDLCASDEGPSYGELMELSRWVWEAQSELPTKAAEASPTGRGTTAASSKGA